MASALWGSTHGSIGDWPGERKTYGATSAGWTCICESTWKGPTPDDGRFWPMGLSCPSVAHALMATSERRRKGRRACIAQNPTVASAPKAQMCPPAV